MKDMNDQICPTRPWAPNRQKNRKVEEDSGRCIFLKPKVSSISWKKGCSMVLKVEKTEENENEDLKTIDLDLRTISVLQWKLTSECMKLKNKQKSNKVTSINWRFYTFAHQIKSKQWATWQVFKKQRYWKTLSFKTYETKYVGSW